MIEDCIKVNIKRSLKTTKSRKVKVQKVLKFDRAKRLKTKTKTDGPKHPVERF